MSDGYSPNWSPGDPLEEGDEFLTDEEAQAQGVDAPDAHDYKNDDGTIRRSSD